MALPERNYCLLGIIAKCPSATASASDGNLLGPDADPLSSWTNITPPTGAPNPSERYEPAEVYYPSGHEVVLFGGWGTPASGGPAEYLQDTWAYANGHWTELINSTSCTPTTCPSPRAGAMLAYYPTENALVLFGGMYSVVHILIPTFYAYNDTWLFENNTWTNITASAGAAPSARSLGAMSYDPSDNYVVLFGGESASFNSNAETWSFSEGSWTNITGTLHGTYPASLEGAAIADSPSGYVMLYGGATSADNGVDVSLTDNPCDGAGGIAWWFDHGQWTSQGNYTPSCIQQPASPTGSNPTPATAPNVAYPPCGRVGASLGWSPKNNRFVLYGGYGAFYNSSGCFDNEEMYLNDTWTYGESPGGGFFWNNASYPAGPPGRAWMGYASDFTDGFFEIFGGYWEDGADLNATWRFYEIVYADLTGPLSFNTGGGLVFSGGPFTVLGYGGTGDLTYILFVNNTRNGNTLATSGGPCDWLYNTSSTALPYDGTVSIDCMPAPTGYGIYKMTLLVVDVGNSSLPFAKAYWTFSVIPPEAMIVYSEYVSDFYTNVAFDNTFTIYAEVAGGAPNSVTATLAGQTLTPTGSSGSKWWNFTGIQMSGLEPGTILSATAQFPGWTENTTYYVTMISTPSWLLSLFQATGATQSIVTHGSGPFNKTFEIDEKYHWDLSDSTNFSFSVPLVGGNYGLIPTVDVVFSASSTGNLSVNGTFSLSTPDISIGPASLKLSASISMTGTFDVVGTGVQWVSASATVTVSASVSASIPILGFSLFGCNVGFTLQLTINPSITLDMILGPSSGQGLFGVDIAIKQFLGSFMLALTAAVNFGIGIASVGLGVGLSVAVAFTLNPFGLTEGWVNGSIFVTAQFFWWSDSFNIVNAAPIVTFGPDASPVEPGSPAYLADSYNNGTNTQWIVQPDYYAASDYDGNIWNATASSGPAISDIYPWTEVTGAAAYNGGYFFYTDQNMSLPPSHGLVISGGRLSASSNSFASVPGPDDPSDYEVVNPQSATLPDGDLYVIWAALPNSEASVNSPLNLTSIELQGAVYFPNNGTWGAVRTFNSGDFAQSYQVDATEGSGAVLELLSDQPFLSNTAPERLVEYNLTTGATLANLSMRGISEIVSLRVASGLAVLETITGNYSLVSLPGGLPVGLSFTPPSGYYGVSATFAEDSASTLVLLYRGSLASELVLYDTADAQTLSTLNLGVDVFEAEAIANGATTYVFVRTALGLDGWTEVAGTFTNLTTVSLPGVVGYGLVQAGGSIVIFSIAKTGGNATYPIRALFLEEVGAALASVPVPAVAKTAAPSSSASPDYLLYLGIAAAAAAFVLAVVFVLTRRRPPNAAVPPPSVTGAAAVEPPPPEPPAT